ncbi:hypothetical protein CANARDRAFT_198353 [[Candida] arabinofermentans NRRL YB-2248]|uniref:Auxin efflux carrier n=1 Tax=[Candida] arabinofermentans NRRL YB-2248 TaxID=983967 RepID=A0A1E4T1A7_9ASCO|nr:hypothetical protein CANARDRAFT_198353 [[Candida] arabinofermentans NRRL YB-2248]
MSSLGSIIYSAVKPVIRMYLIIFTGFFLTRMGLFSVTVARSLSDMVLILFMPALVVDKIVSYISINDIKTIGVMFLSAVLMYVTNAGVAAGIIYLTPIPKARGNSWVGGAMLAGVMQNVSDLPIAYLQAMTNFTDEEVNKGTAYVIIWLAMYVIVQFNCGAFQLVEYDFRYRKDEEEEEDEHNNLENPVSPVSSISESLSSDQPDSADEENNKDLAPKALMSNSSNTNRIAPVLSHISVARIPSARTQLLPIDALAPSTSGMASGVMPRRMSHESPASFTEEMIREYSRAEPYNKNVSSLMNIITETNLSSKDVKDSGKSIPFIQKYHLNFLIFFLRNFKKPSSIALIISLTIALIPWLKALFTTTSDGVYMPNAPDGEPPLSFLLQYVQYVGSPCVPLGLILVGSLLGRLEVKKIPKGFWKSVLASTTYRLGILPIIGILWADRMKKIGWLTEPMALFVNVMEFSLPSATVQTYLTVSAMRPGEQDCTPMDCLALYLISQYAVLAISLPIVVCYSIKNVLNM